MDAIAEVNPHLTVSPVDVCDTFFLCDIIKSLRFTFIHCSFTCIALLYKDTTKFCVRDIVSVDHRIHSDPLTVSSQKFQLFRRFFFFFFCTIPYIIHILTKL